MREYTASNYTQTRYVWCGERICQALGLNDAVTRRYYDEGEQLVTTNGNTPYFYAQDHLGSVRDVVSSSGTVLASYDYDPYGNPTRSTQGGSTRADYRYAGLFYHAQSGLYLTHYRVYDPITGRWISRDPIGEAGGINLYGYVGGDSVMRTDPTGLWWDCHWPSKGDPPNVENMCEAVKVAKEGGAGAAKPGIGTNGDGNVTIGWEFNLPYVHWKCQWVEDLAADVKDGMVGKAFQQHVEDIDRAAN